MSIKLLFQDGYSVKARLIPALVTILPTVALIVWWGRGRLALFLQHCAYLVKIGIIVAFIPFVLLSIIWIWSFFISVFAKWGESIVFKDGKTYPTTNLLMWQNPTWPQEYKRKIHNAICDDFSINLLDAEGELETELTARKLIVSAVDCIRTKVGNGRIVLQYNTEYGFARNLVVGSFFAFIVSIVDLFIGIHIGQDSFEYFSSIVFLIAYGIVLILAKPMLTFLAKLYAKSLISEYMSIRSNK